MKGNSFFENNTESDISTLTLKGGKLIDFYSNPENFNLANISGKNKKLEMPRNVFVSLSHGSYELPIGFEDKLCGYNSSLLGKESALRLLKNFSDFGTSYIMKYIPMSKKNLITTQFSRAIGDCNRDIENISAAGYIKETDFNGINLFTNKDGFHESGVTHYKTFHNEITTKLLYQEKNDGKTILFDLHDTGIFLLGRNQEDDKIKDCGFPYINISDHNGKSCDQEIFQYFSERLEFYMGVKVFINEPYAGGFVTQKHGTAERDAGNKLRNVIQIEVARYLYMYERTQEVDEEKTNILAHCLENAMKDTGVKFS